MTYDAMGRVLTAASTKTGVTEKYHYSSTGLRTLVEEFSGTTLLKSRVNIYNDARQLVSQYEKAPAGALTWKRDIVYLGTREAAEYDSQGIHVTMVDHLGTPRLITKANSILEAKQKFLPFIPDDLNRDLALISGDLCFFKSLDGIHDRLEERHQAMALG